MLDQHGPGMIQAPAQRWEGLAMPRVPVAACSMAMAAQQCSQDVTSICQAVPWGQELVRQQERGLAQGLGLAMRQVQQRQWARGRGQAWPRGWEQGPTRREVKQDTSCLPVEDLSQAHDAA